MGKVIEEKDWSSYNYSENSDPRGMTTKAFEEFSKASQRLILEFLIYLKTINDKNEYENVFILAHSRGCSLAINTLSNFQLGKEVNIDENEMIGKLKRVVLLDPVGKNANSTDEDIIFPNNAKIIKDLSELGKEIHIIVKSKVAKINYESYADRLVGTRKGGVIDQYNSESPDMRMIYVHIADMKHEGMLQEEFKQGFKNYEKIISETPWNNIYDTTGEVVKIEDMEGSHALNEYIEGEKTADDIKPSEDGDDAFYKILNQIEISELGSLKDRRRGFVHCVAKKVMIARSHGDIESRKTMAGIS